MSELYDGAQNHVLYLRRYSRRQFHTNHSGRLWWAGAVDARNLASIHYRPSNIFLLARVPHLLSYAADLAVSFSLGACLGQRVVSVSKSANYKTSARPTRRVTSQSTHKALPC